MPPVDASEVDLGQIRPGTYVAQSEAGNILICDPIL